MLLVIFACSKLEVKEFILKLKINMERCVLCLEENCV